MNLNPSIARFILGSIVVLGVAPDVMAQARRSPTSPARLSATAGSNGSVTLKWTDRSINERGFKITRLPAFPDGDKVVQANQSSFSDTPGAGTFTYRVAAFNNVGTSSWTSAARVTVTGGSTPGGSNMGMAGGPGTVTPNPAGSITFGIPAMPTDLTATPGTNSIQLAWWDHADNEVYFEIEKQVQVGQNWQAATGLQAWLDNATLTDPVSPGTFRYRIRAAQHYGYSPFTDWVVVSLLDPTAPPAAPSSVIATDAGSGRAMVAWTDNSNNETSFQIERNPAFAGGVMSVNANVSSYMDICGNGSFSYRVRSANAAGMSTLSPWVSINVTSGSTGGGGSGGGGGGGTGGTEGWTNLSLPAGAQAFYVAANGADTNAGTQTAPFKTIQRGYQALRDGQQDQLLLRCGDTFNMNGGTISVTKGAASGYMVIGSYGTGARPKITGTNTAFNGESIGKRGVAFVGLEFEGARVTDSRAIRLLGWRDVLIEDCSIHDHHRGLIFQGYNTRGSGLKVRRSVWYDMVSPACIGTNCPQAMYIDATDNWLIEENFFDKCGMTGSMYSRPVYLQDDCGRGTFTGNVMSRNPAEGVQVRAGGVVTNNLSLRNPIGMYIGHNGQGTNDIRYNVVLESGDIGTGGLERGRGIHLNGPSDVRFNVLAYNTGRGWGAVHGLYLQSASGTCTDNYIYEWTRSPSDGGPGDPLEAQSILSDGGTWTISNNRVFMARQGIVLQPGGTISGTANSYSEPPSGPATFRPNNSFSGWASGSLPTDPALRAMLPGGGIDAYADRIRLQSRQNWDATLTASAVNNAIRARVGIANP